MPSSQRPIQSLDELRDYVNDILCDHNQLEPGAFRMTQRMLVRCGKPCGMYFCLHGPRAVQFTAIWDSKRNTVLFYSSTGERFRKTQLVGAPTLQLAAA